MNQSTKFTFSKNDLKRIGLHLLIVAVAAVLTELIKDVPTMNFGANQIFVVPVISMILKGVLTFVQGK